MSKKRQLESFYYLSHGTDSESAEEIRNKGFKLGDSRCWCGQGVYFYHQNAKAWWYAKGKCRNIEKSTGKKLNPAVIHSDIIDIDRNDIFDMRDYKDLCNFEELIQELLENKNLDCEDFEKKNDIRSIFISFYSDKYKKKLIVGNFRQNNHSEREHAVEFANNLNMVFGMETIICVKDISVISNIR